ncbi:glycosyltransferase [Gephyromycinifex aptenodytis]|uniref:glycosyltransferase n=1 Tax=Gephyromycinifex aptenodytis TaxID=2716227 RepID=UPI0014476AE9|nr:glycosyltransferase [Gephyromycinifex aptenodytis]
MNATPVTTSIVIPYYADQTSLDIVLAALAAQTYPTACMEVIVADDGSPQPPQLGSRPYASRLVRQEDRGFRAAAARNLGAAVASGQVVCFLDGDTIPEPDYVATMTARVASSGALVVGRRRHADLRGLSSAQVVAWLARQSAGAPAQAGDPSVLAEPAWLAQGYADSDNLRAADERSYRFVISAVLAMPAELFARVGGFDASFVGYGGEDWELANRLWLAGADLRYEPAAVAWHDGPDIAGREVGLSEQQREQARREKNAETLRCAHLITEPGARDPGLVWEYPDIVVTLDDRGYSPAQVMRCVSDLVRGSDARVWLRDGALLTGGGWPSTDLRVVAGPPPAAALARARFQVQVDRPVILTGASLAQLCAHAPCDFDAGVRIRRTRDLARGIDQVAVGDACAVVALTEEPSLEAWWGWQRGVAQ